MIELELENRIVDLLERSMLNTEWKDKVQILTCWRNNEQMKGQECSDKSAYITVRVNPREYDTPTIPDAQIQVQLSLTVLADSDCFGDQYMVLTELMTNMLQEFQNSHDKATEAFSLEGKFLTTGFQITGGGVGMDSSTMTWQFQQSFSLYGIVRD